MKERVCLLDILMDIVPTREAGEMTLQFLTSEGSRVVYIVNSETFLLQQSEPELKEYIEACELVLPADASVSDSIDQVLGHRRDSFFLESYFDIVFDYAVDMGYEILLVAENEKSFISIQENIHEKRPVLTLSGVYLTEREESMEHIVNEINSVAPDILLVALNQKQQLELIRDYRSQINARLMLFSGNSLYNRAVSEQEVPEPIQKLKFDNVYKWFSGSGRMKALWADMAMKIKVRLHHKGDRED